MKFPFNFNFFGNTFSLKKTNANAKISLFQVFKMLKDKFFFRFESVLATAIFVMLCFLLINECFALGLSSDLLEDINRKCDYTCSYDILQHNSQCEKLVLWTGIYGDFNGGSIITIPKTAHTKLSQHYSDEDSAISNNNYDENNRQNSRPIIKFRVAEFFYNSSTN